MEMSSSTSNLVNEPTKLPRLFSFRAPQKQTIIKLALITSSAFLLVLITTVIAITSVNRARAQSTESNNCSSDDGEAICKSEECLKLSEDFSSFMDSSVDPCEDFYQYACGGWLDKNDLPATALEYSRFKESQLDIDRDLRRLLETNDTKTISDAERKAAIFYQSCADKTARKVTSSETVRQFVDVFGGWPIIEDDWKDADYEPFSAIARMNGYSIKGRMYAFAVRLNGDVRKRTAIGVAPNAGDLLRNDVNSTIEVYKELIRKTIALIANESYVNEKEVQEIVAFEMSLANLATSAPVIDTVQNVTEKFSGFDWKKVLDNVFENVSNKFDMDTQVQLMGGESYLKGLIELISGTSERAVANYLGWRAVQFLAPFSSLESRSNLFVYENISYQVEKQSDLEESCVGFVTQFFPYAVGSLYKKHHFKEEHRKDTVSMIRELKSSFSTLIELNDWMDDSTKNEAQSKLDAMSEAIAMPDWLSTDAELDNFYKGIEVVEGDFTKTVINYYGWSTKRSLGLLNVEPEHYNWERSPVDINAFYVTSWNLLVLPVAMFNEPFYGHDRPAAVNFATMGFVVGHEMTHGFDSVGRLNGRNGRRLRWWSTNSSAEFDVRAKCFADQYSGFEFMGQKVSGLDTLAENIADNGGLREALKAYEIHIAKYGSQRRERLPGAMSGYSTKQLFFLSFANMWCNKVRPSFLPMVMAAQQAPSAARVMGTLQNSREFAKAFQCSDKSKMNRENKCAMW